MNMSFEENVYGLIKELEEFSYTIESIDPIWGVIFPHKTSRYDVYHYLRVTKYRDTFYIELVDGELCSLEIRMNISVQVAQSFGSSHGVDDPARGWNSLISIIRKAL